MAAPDDEPSNGERSRPCGLPRSRSLPQFSHHDSGLGSYYGGSGGDEVQASRTARFVADIRQLITLKQHYYPEGGWGWIVLWTAVLVHILANGFLASAGLFQLEIVRKFGPEFRKQTEWLGAVSTGISLLISPIVIAFCRRRSTRVTAVMGGLIAALGCLFTSFATQFHQLMFRLTKNRSHLWLEALGIDPEKDKYSDGISICSNHFLPEYITISPIGRMLLRPGVISSINLGPNVEIRKSLLAKEKSSSRQSMNVPVASTSTEPSRSEDLNIECYGTVVGIGVGITRDCSILMVAQYFKRRRELVEVFVVSGSGLGIVIMSLLIKITISSLGWRLGLQVITGTVSVTFILGTFYRSASLYHPQRRAILHIKNQKRKIRDKNRIEDKIPFFDLSALKSNTVRILLFSTAITAFGINTPLFYLAYQAKVEGLEDWIIFVQIYLGLACSLGCIIFSTLVLHKTSECRVARQYLCQSAVFMCGLSVLAFTVVNNNYHAYVMFAWIYGFFYGGYHYSLKMYTYERVRARHFSRTWGFVQFSQAVPIAVGIPLSGYLNDEYGNRTGYYFSSVCTLVGSLALFLTDLHRHRISHHKHTRENGTRHLCVNESCPQSRKLSFSQEPENDHGNHSATTAAAFILGADMVQNNSGGVSDNIILSADKGELTCISEEGIADMDLPDDILDDLDYIGDCITSCNKVENYLMLSEFENNLFAEMPSIIDRRGRRWSLAGFLQNKDGDQPNDQDNEKVQKNTAKSGKWNMFPNKVVTVVDESSV